MNRLVVPEAFRNSLELDGGWGHVVWKRCRLKDKRVDGNAIDAF
jgi:hypothetical protein